VKIYRQRYFTATELDIQSKWIDSFDHRADNFKLLSSQAADLVSVITLCAKEPLQFADIVIEVGAAAPIEEVAGMYEDISCRDF